MKQANDQQGKNISTYAGRWIAKLHGDIVGQGGTPEQAIQAAKYSRPKENPEISFVPLSTPLLFSPLLKKIYPSLPQDVPIYLVGGAVRDALMDLPIHDFDFVLSGNALEISRKIANQIGGAYFPLDLERGTARIIYTDEDGIRYILDFATNRGPDLESDLRSRDFTINAIALDIHSPQELLDPLGGANDLREKRLRVCSPSSMIDDPVRVLRAIRIASNFGLRIDSDTQRLMRKVVSDLNNISPERQRDELLRILEGKKPQTSIRALEVLGAVEYIFPELPALTGLSQSPPHIKDVWSHTLDTLRILDELTKFLSDPPDPNISGNLMFGLLGMRLGRYREKIRSHLQHEPIVDRSIKSLLFLAALYHDVAKPETRSVEDNGLIRYFNHDQIGAQIIKNRAKAFRFSKKEIERLATIIRYHMRPSLLSHSEVSPSKRAVYRFFRDTSDAGVDICLLSLADVWATYGSSLPQERWERQVETVRTLLEAWWERSNEQIYPPALISGTDLIKYLNLNPGPIHGEILEAVREAQVKREVNTREDALVFVKKYLDTMNIE